MSGIRAETEEAFAEYKRLAERGDWARWADLFTEDALYEEHWLGTFRGRDAIKSWIVDLSVTNRCSVWIEWQMFDENRVCVYAWNNFPDPTGTGRRFTIPSSSLLEYAGEGKFSWEGDYYNGSETESLIRGWQEVGGGPHMSKDFDLRGVEGWAPDPPAVVFPRREIEQAFERYCERRAAAVENHRWDAWSEVFTRDAVYRNHRLGRVDGQAQIRDFADEMLTAPPVCAFQHKLRLIDGNRVSALARILVPDAAGGSDHGFDVNTILHYAGDGRWSYAEDLYNPIEAVAARQRSGRR